MGRISICIVGLVILGAVASSSAITHRVPSQFGTIQAAMDAAAAGDTVLVAPGVYTDCDGGPCLPAVVVMKTGTTLISEGGPDVTTMRADTFVGSSPVVNSRFLGALGAEINGFRITASVSGRGGIGALDSRSLTVRNCWFEDLENFGLSLNASELTTNSLEVTDCVFLRCRGSSIGAGLFVSSVDVLVEDCLFEDCIGGAMSFFGTDTQTATIRNCTFRNNQAASTLAAHGCKSFDVEGCVFDGNDASPSTGVLQVTVPAGKRLNVTNSVFLNNISLGAGGAVYALGSGIVTLEGNSIVGSVGTISGAAVFALGTVLFENNVVVSTVGGAALWHGLGTITGSCNVFWNNIDGDFQNYTPDPTDSLVDPLFCDEAGGDIRVASDSPCLAVNSNGCGLIGALGQGCGVISVEKTSWGRLKSLYR